jgi:hypothetical protein
MERLMRDVNEPTRHELVGMRSLLLAMLLVFVAMQYEHRATRSVPLAMRRAHGTRIREGSRDGRELGPLRLEQGMCADA